MSTVLLRDLLKQASYGCQLRKW